MAEMQTLKVEFSDIPDALPAQPTRLFVDFSDIPDAVPQGEPEQTPQVEENPLSGKNILKVDFSDIPDALPVQQKTLHVDFSDIPDREPDATGLVYYPAEYYDPASGGAINRDPPGFKDWLKSYLYSADDPVRLADATGPTLADPGTAAANAGISNLGSGLNSQADLGDHGMPMPGGSAANIYKQWLIGAIEFFSELGWNSPRPDLAGDVSFTSLTGLPYRSPFAAPKDAADATARFMGASQIPALAGLAFEGPAGSLSGTAAVTESPDGLAGQWIAVKESMSPSASAYQAQITGKVGQAYILNGVKFDGVETEILLEAKGPRYANFVQNGKFQGWFRGERELVDQAHRQMRAAKGAPIQWHVAEEEAVQALQNLFDDEGITGIKIIYTPPSQ